MLTFIAYVALAWCVFLIFGGFYYGATKDAKDGMSISLIGLVLGNIVGWIAMKLSQAGL